jgi:23S rRNA pseudouridine2605 synthase
MPPRPRPPSRPRAGARHREGPPRSSPSARARPRPDSAAAGQVGDGLERLQKVLAAAGIASRRGCEELIAAGRVEVDRVIVSQLGVRVDPRAQEIRVDGERLPRVRRVVYMLNKPVGVVTTNADPAGRPRVVDLVPGERRLFAVGRLDRMSEGLILLTNDGPLANLLAHPRYAVEKKYLVQVAGVPAEELLERLHRGIQLAEGQVHAKRVTIRTQHKQSAVLEMVLDEGKNREIRRMLARLGHKVHQLKRIAVGSLTLGNLLPGQWRQLSWDEVESLRRGAQKAADLAPEPSRFSGPPRGRPQRPPAGGRRAARATTQGRRPGKPRRPGKASTWRKARSRATPPGD